MTPGHHPRRVNQNTDMIEIEVRGLSAAEIRVGETRITPSQERVFQTVFYLAIRAGERIPRSDLVETLWGTEPTARGRQSLRQMLYRLRQMGLTLDESGDTVQLDPARLRCDVSEALRDEWVSTAGADAVWAAADLLPGTGQRTTPGFEEWLEGLRARLASQFRRAALRHVAEAKRAARWREVEELALRVLYNDPLNEEATLARAEALAMQGSKAMALDVLDAYAKELGERNDRIGLPARVLRKRITDSGSASAPQSGGGRLPLIGRHSEMSIVTTLFGQRSVTDKQTTIEIRGPAGIGKTRLAAEILDVARLAGFSVIEFTTNAPHQAALATDLARAVGTGLLALPGAVGAHPTSIGTITRICRENHESAGATGVPSSTLTIETLSAALADIVTSVAEERRLLLLVDDTYRFSPQCTRLLKELLTRTSGALVTWTLCTRTQRQTHDPDAIHAEYPLELGLLSHEESRELVRSHLDAQGKDLDDAAVDSIAQFGRGHPQALITASGLLADSSTPQGHRTSLRMLATNTIASLSRLSVTTLHATVLLDRYATPTIVREATGLSASETGIALADLHERGIVYLSPDNRLTTLEPWQEATTFSLSSVERAVHASAAADALKRSLGEALDASALTHTAELYSTAGDQAEAVRLLRRAVALLERRGLASDALASAQKALALATDPGDRHEILQILASLHYRLGQLDKALNYCDEFSHTLHTAPSTPSTTSLRVAAIAADATWKLNRPFDAALDVLLSLLNLGVGDDDSFYDAGLTALRLSLIAPHSPLAEEVKALVQRRTTGFPPHPLRTLIAVIFHAERGPAPDLRRAALEADGQSALVAPAHTRAIGYRYRSIAWRYLGETLRAAGIAEQGYCYATQEGLAVEAHLMAVQSLFLSLDAEDLPAAHTWLNRALKTIAYSPGEERVRALVFGQARLAIQEGKFSEVEKLYADIDLGADEAYMPRRYALDTSCIALALSKIGDATRAAALARQSLKVSLSSDSTQQMDCAVEYASRALALCGFEVDARDYVDSYLAIRDRSFSRFLPFYFSALWSGRRRSEETP